MSSRRRSQAEKNCLSLFLVQTRHVGGAHGPTKTNQREAIRIKVTLFWLRGTNARAVFWFYVSPFREKTLESCPTTE